MVKRERPTTDEDPISALVATFSEIARTLSSGGSVDDTLVLALGLAETLVEGCDFAGLFLLDADAVTSGVRTVSAVTSVDAIQHQAGEGPSLDALAQGVSVYAEDLA